MAARPYQLKGGARPGSRTTGTRSGEDPGGRAAGTSVLGVAALVSGLKGLVEGRFSRAQVQGEISGFKRAASGHCYFTLKDDRAQIASVLFRGAAARAPLTLRDGLEVVATGRVSIYEARGQLQLIVDRLEAAGEGALRAAFEALRERLEKEGLFAQEAKQGLPELPRCVGVVSSPSGAAIHDFLQVLGRRAPQVSVLLAPTRVQGAFAAEEIARALRRLDAEGCDVLVVTRGGGSLEDLWAFNEEVLLRAIAACNTPVISAVGHEVDLTLADLVADLRAPTPSAAAEVVVPRQEALREKLDALSRRLLGALRVGAKLRRVHLLRLGAKLGDPRRSLGSRRQHLDGLHLRTRRVLDGRLRAARAVQTTFRERLELQHPRRRLVGQTRQLATLSARLLAGGPAPQLRAARARLGVLETALQVAVRGGLQTERQHLAQAEASLGALSPQAVLDRGFALVADDTGKLLRDASAIVPGDELTLRLARGEVIAQALRTNPRTSSGEDEA